VIDLTDYVEILKNNDLKVTPQRLEILKYLDKNKVHPTASKIYTDLKKRNPSLSKTTIYNSLETLKRNNIINELTIEKTESRYEFEKTMHHHFLCKSCGKIADIDIECPHLNEMLKSKYKVHQVHGYFKAICEDCLKKERLKKKKK
jgi:Fe2+ or Zn2+ uptake regulation protein